MGLSTKELKETIEGNRAKIKDLHTRSQTEGGISEEEMTQLEQLVIDVEGGQAKLDTLEKARNIAINKAHATAKRGSEESQIAKKFSLLNTVRSIKNGTHKHTEGVEAEIHQEAQKESRASGVELQGFGLPSSIVKEIYTRATLEQRAPASAGTPATAGNLIATDLYTFVDALRPMLKLGQLGATLWGGLSGNVEIPAGNAIATATFNTETGTATETNPTTKKVTMSPKRLAAWTSATLQLLAQSSISVDNWLMMNMLYAEMNKVESVALFGGGTNEPTGILGWSGTNVIQANTDANAGANLTRAKLIAMETAVETENADEDNMGFLTTTGVKGFLKNLPINGTGSDRFVWSDNNEVIGYQGISSNLMPKNFDKGTYTESDLHTMIFGAFRNLIIGNWGVRDITIDEVTQKKSGINEVIMNSFWDVACVHEKKFSVIKDILVS